MTPEELAAIRERANAATAGPWSWDEPFDNWIAQNGLGYLDVRNSDDTVIAVLEIKSEKDAAFIAAAREDVPALLDEVERLRTRDVAYEAEFKRIEAIAVKKANAVAPYEVFPSNENTTCPKCNAHPRLLCAADWQPELPAFYVCGCGYIGQIGVGPVVEQSA